MNKFERVQAALNGEPTDRIPYAFWSHLPGIDLNPELLAKETLSFCNSYDIDIVKMMSNGMYPIEDFGCVCDYSEIASGGVAKVVSTPVHDYNDWSKIPNVSTDAPSLKRELTSLKNHMKLFRDRAPVLFTLFSPFTTAHKLSGGKILEHIRSGNTTLVEHALESIAQTTSSLAKKAIDFGASGVFFATQLSSYDFTTEEEYREYGTRYDLLALDGAQKGWLNTLHIHGENIMFKLLKDYPVHVLNWHVWETEPEIQEARKISNKCFMGGINRKSITSGDHAALEQQINDSIKQSGGKKHILTPGCVIRYPLIPATLKYIEKLRDAVSLKACEKQEN